ncbi:hypothetical protein [Conchiformibius kuhniae]|uniref:Uncharacterized protein n=1 Tax=Conchiformibius kuhniae TaxID=211502 RepID=A0A8T9MSU8_9NEIS|nr:hypothetical protein [Conchiformibius kuhniae]UOP04351.1 hypothetical protein LVJ77_08365 [Conchiformibius kuhniae]
MHTLPQETINNLKARRITDDDWAFLKSLPDYPEIKEIYFFDDYFAKSGHHIVEISDTEKIFSLGDILGLTSSYRFVYVKNQSICILIDTLECGFSIYFCSPKLLNNIEYVKTVFNYSIMRFGWDFIDNLDVSEIFNFGFIESKNKYFD